MNTLKRWHIALLVFGSMLLGLEQSGAAPKTAALSGNWSETTTWVGGEVPVAGDAVTINSSINITVDTPASCDSIAFLSPFTNGIFISGANSLTVSGAITTVLPNANNRHTWISVGAGSLSARSIALLGGGTASRYTDITISSGSVTVSNITTAGAQSRITFSGAGTLNISGTFMSSGTPGTFTPSTGTVNYNADGPQTVGPYTYKNLTLSGSGEKTIVPAVTVNGILSMEGTATASASPTYGAAATLCYNTATARAPGPEWPSSFTGTGGVLITNTGAITLNADKVLGPSAPLTIRSGATLDTDAANDRSLSFGGNFTNNGTFTANASPIIISGTAAQSISGFTTLGDVSMTKTALTATFLGNVTGGSLTINGTGGTLSLGAGLTHTFAGTWTVTDGTLNGGSSTLKLGSDGNRTGGTFTGGTGTVEWNAEGPQTIANVTYYNLLFSGSGAKSMPAGTTVANNLTIPTGDITASVGSGLNLGVETLTLGGIGRKYGTWGSSASTANFTNDVFFSATTGYLTVNTDTRVYCIWNGTGDWFVDIANWSNSVPPGDGSNVLIVSGTVMLTNNTPLLDTFMITNSTLTFRN